MSWRILFFGKDRNKNRYKIYGPASTCLRLQKHGFMLSLGIDIGSSSIKVAVYDHAKGITLGTGQYPEQEMKILSLKEGWAEQEPEWWWDAFLKAFQQLKNKYKLDLSAVRSIGIAYQMHGLVCLDKVGNTVRPSIIWCDSRAVPYGQEALEALGEQYAFSHLLNSPGNFTAAKLAWVKDQEPALFEKIDKVCLPGDYLAYRLTGELTTTISGLSEGIFFDFERQQVSAELLAHFGFSNSILPTVKPSFAKHGTIKAQLAQTLGLSPAAEVTYKAGDQPNNALSLNVLQPGEIAATAGTSGVVYGVSDQLFIDETQRVNSFAHVNYTPDSSRIGVLLCINGTGIANSWAQQWTGAKSYTAMNELVSNIPPGSEGLSFWPFGNGAERMLGNANPGSQLKGLQFNWHKPAHLYRAVQEGIAYSFLYGMEAFTENGMDLQVIRAGQANMFLSQPFVQTLASLAGVSIELYNTDGALGAARGALIGAGTVSLKEAFKDLQIVQTFQPKVQEQKQYQELYPIWKKQLLQQIS